MSEHPTRVRIALVFGGASSEHEISCLTAGSVARAIDQDRFEVLAIGITRAGDWVRVPLPELAAFELRDGVLPHVAEDLPGAVLLRGANGVELATRDGAALSAVTDVDVVFALLHGPYGEDGTVQGMLEMLGARYVGAGVAASAIGMDKDLMKRAMSAAGLPVGPWQTITPAQWRDEREACLTRVGQLRLPVFVKPARGGSSLGIGKVDRPEDLTGAIIEAQRYDPKVVIEQGFVGAREIELAVIENPSGPPRVSVPGEIIVHTEDAFYDFEAKYLAEKQVTLSVPADLEPAVVAAVQDLAARTFASMGVEGLARVDLFLGPDGQAWVNELNTMPGFTRMSMFPMMWAASGLAYPDLITTLIDLARQRPIGLR